MKHDLFPKFIITSAMLSRVAAICERLGRLHGTFRRDLRLRRINRIRTIQASLQIEGNVLTVEQVTAVLDGKKVIYGEATRMNEDKRKLNNITFKQTPYDIKAR